MLKRLLSLRFFVFVSMMFFIFCADAVMSYLAPVVIENVVGGTVMMGLILGSSSIMGMTTDFAFAKLFTQKKAFFFQRVFFLIVFLFPLSFLFSLHPLSLILAMLWWGISYEAMIFSTYHAIHETVNRVHHAWAWGVVSTLHAVALSIGPYIASRMIEGSVTLPIFISIIFNSIAVSLFFIYSYLEKKRKKSFFDPEPPTIIQHRTFLEMMEIWKTLDTVLWPLLLFLLLYYFFESAVYSVGPLISETLKLRNELGSLFVSIYGLPGIFIGVFLGKLSRPFGKKKLAFIAGVLGGFSAILLGLSTSVGLILIFMFFASLGFAVVHPMLTAVFEDLLARNDNVANDLISLTSMVGSFSYVVGPVVNGFLAETFGQSRVFLFWGVSVFFVSIWLLLTFPRKIRLPQKELLELVEEASS